MAQQKPGGRDGWHVFGPDEQVYILERTAASGQVHRTIVQTLKTGGLLVVHPQPNMSDEDHRLLARIGKPRVVLALNDRDHEGLDAFVRAHEGVQVVASHAAQSRLRSKVTSGLSDLRWLQPLLSEYQAIMTPKGLRNGEVWIRTITTWGTAWTVGDAFLDLGEVPRNWYGLTLALRGYTTGLCIPAPFRRRALASKANFRAWIFEQLRERPPMVLLPPHGKVVHDPDLPSEIKRLVEDLT